MTNRGLVLPPLNGNAANDGGNGNGNGNAANIRNIARANDGTNVTVEDTTNSSNYYEANVSVEQSTVVDERSTVDTLVQRAFDNATTHNSAVTANLVGHHPAVTDEDLDTDETFGETEREDEEEDEEADGRAAEEEEEDDDDDDDDDNDLDDEADADGNYTQGITEIDPETEIVVDGNKRWIPIHLLRKNRAVVWTHFLGLNKALLEAKCKHCGEVIKKSDNPVMKSSIKKFQAHLRKKHKINPNESFYKKTPFPARRSHRQDQHSHHEQRQGQGDDDAHLSRPSFRPERSVSDFNNFMGTSLINFVNSNSIITNPSTITTQNHMNNGDITSITENQAARMSNERLLSFSTNQLLSIIIASENLPLSFVENSSVKLLLSRVPGSYNPDPKIIHDSINRISNAIDEMITRTVFRNNADMSLIISNTNFSQQNSDPTSQSDEEVRNNQNVELIQKLGLFLNEMSKINFFSFSHCIWNKNTSLLSLQFYDEISSTMKILPLLTSRSKDESDTTSVSLRTQLNTVFRTIPGLYKTVLSATLPRSKITDMLNVDDFFLGTNDLNPKNFYHNCIVTILTDAITPLFGSIENEVDDLMNASTINSEPVQENSLPNDYFNASPLDTLIDLSHVNIEGSIFHKINLFYEELFSNSWQLDRFKTLCGEHLNDPEIKLIPFDKFKYSSAEECLERFIDLRPVIELNEPRLNSGRFTEVDFQIMSYMLETLQSINRLILYFASGTSGNFIYVLFAILHVERHLASTISNVQFQRLIKPFQAVLANIREVKQVLLTDDMNLLAMFLCPAVLFEREILEYAFKSISLSDIVDIVSTTVFDLLKRFIDVETLTQQNPRMNQLQMQMQLSAEHNEQPHATSFDAINESSIFASGRENMENTSNMDTTSNDAIKETVDTLLMKLIQEDLYEYLSTVNSIVPVSYKAFCDESGYVRYNNRFKKGKPLYDGESNADEQARIIAEELANVQPMNYIDELMDIHVPVCNAFWAQLLKHDAGVVIKILIRIMRTQAASSVRSEYSFLKNFKPRAGADLFEQIVKIRVFNEQFVAGKVDFDLDTLSTASQYR